MRRASLVVSVLVVVLLGSLAVAWAQGTPAQQATPTIQEVPIEILGSVPSAEAPGYSLFLARVTFPVGFTEPAAHIHPFDYVVSVQSGTLAFTIEEGALQVMRAGATEPETVPIGEEVTVGPGDSFAGTRDVVWSSERVEGDEAFVVIGTFLGLPDSPLEVYVDATPGAATPAA